MAGNLNKTKHRIASINSTKKITKAMELVSTVKLKKFKNVMLKNELYSNELKSLTCTLFSRLDDEENKYTKLNDAEKDLIIGFINHKNEIKRVVINGEDEFEKNSRFKINEKIIVEYHSFK